MIILAWHNLYKVLLLGYTLRKIMQMLRHPAILFHVYWKIYLLFSFIYFVDIWSTIRWEKKQSYFHESLYATNAKIYVSESSFVSECTLLYKLMSSTWQVKKQKKTAISKWRIFSNGWQRKRIYIMLTGCMNMWKRNSISCTSSKCLIM